MLILCPIALKLNIPLLCIYRYLPFKFWLNHSKIGRGIAHFNHHLCPTSNLSISPPILARSSPNLTCDSLFIQSTHSEIFVLIASLNPSEFILLVHQNKLAVIRSISIQSVHNSMDHMRVLPKALIQSFVQIALLDPLLYVF